MIYSDDTGINVSSIGIGDITILDPLSNPLTILSVTVSPAGNGTPRTATYKFAVPVNGLAGWDGTDNGTYSVSLKANEVFDIDGNPAFAGPLGTFKVAIPITYTVDEVSDVDDANTAVGFLSFREAIRLANTDTAPSSIVFDAAKFAGTKTISMLTANGDQMAITEGVTITGPAGGLILDGSGMTPSTTSRVFNIDPTVGGDVVSISNMTVYDSPLIGASGAGILNVDAALTLTKVNVTNNSTDGEGGGIQVSTATGSLTLINSTVSNNKATGAGSNGGGIDIRSNSVIVITDSTVSGNSSGEDGGGIYFFVNGTLTMNGSTVSGNASNTAAAGAGGGGMYLFSTTTTIRNSTISGNSSNNSNGGGIAALSATNLTVKNSTIAFNDAGTGLGGGIHNSGYATINMDSTIVSNNNAGTGKDVNGTLANANFSLLSVSAGATITTGGNNVLDSDPGLGILTVANGGLTATHAITNSSSAYNAGSNVDTLAFDQRGSGFSRTKGAQTDIGAFEVQTVTPPPTVVGNVAINSGFGAQRSRVFNLVVNFSEAVTLPGAPETAFVLTRIANPSAGPESGLGTGAGQTVKLVATQVGSQVTLTFVTGGVIDVDPGNSLKDGTYQLTILAGSVTGAGGQLDGNGDLTGGDNFLTPAGVGDPNRIFRLFGDGNGTGTVDGIDFGLFRAAFGLPAAPGAAFDFDGGLAVDGIDFSAFRGRFGTNVP